jgi:SAM-dependent methyltransferase
MSFLFSYWQFRKLSTDRQDLQLAWRDRYACLHDNTGRTGFDRHYVFHTAWAARILIQNMPAKHIDISSSLYFCSILSALISIEFYDYRPAVLDLDNLCSMKGNLLSLPFEDASILSISCMHVVEHIGLGRYGDKMDSHGDLRAIAELKRVLAPKGNLLFVVPVGQPRTIFNAHRIYSYAQIMDYFSELELIEFSLIPDDESMGGLIRNAKPDLVKGQVYGCGCFCFQKP